MQLRNLLVLLPFLTNLVAASDVLDLSAGTFDQEVLSEKLALVEFFAPWCGHCKNLAPHYEEAATSLKSHPSAAAVGGTIKLAKVDCTVEQDLCGRFEVRGYPTLKVFRSGQPTDYSGPRKADGIVSYMLKQALPAISDITANNHDEFKESDRVVVIAYGSAPSAFTSLADQLRDAYLFGHAKETSLASSTDLSGNGIVLYKKFDEGISVYRGDVNDVDELTAFIASNALPLVDQVSPENYATYAEAGLPLVYVFASPESPDLDALVESIKPLARERKGSLNFVWIDAVKFAEHGKSLSVPLDDLPAVVIQDMSGKSKKFVLPQVGKSINAQVIKSFVAQFQSGSLQPTLKSAAVPASQDEAAYVLVGEEFDKVVYDDAKDVFVEFYAPWCGHCQRLAPIWDTLAEHFEEFADTLTIAKMDATENDIPPSAPFEVSGFPTLKFKKAGTRDFIDYSGDRSLESLIEFVMENSANPIETVDSDAVELGVVEGEVEGDEQSGGGRHDEL